jgi:hypothetical protein
MDTGISQFHAYIGIILGIHFSKGLLKYIGYILSIISVIVDPWLLEWVYMSLYTSSVFCITCIIWSQYG